MSGPNKPKTGKRFSMQGKPEANTTCARKYTRK
jgi:hypothetical protein